MNKVKRNFHPQLLSQTLEYQELFLRLFLLIKNTSTNYHIKIKIISLGEEFFTLQKILVDAHRNYKSDKNRNFGCM